MPFSQTFLDLLRHRLDHEAIFRRSDRVGAFTVRQGQALVRCLWHEDSTPSLSLDVRRGLFHCFGCGASGDSITFYQRIQGLEHDFPEAIRQLAVIAGLDPDHEPVAASTAPPSLEQQEALLETWVPPTGAAAARAEDRIIDERIVDACHERLLAEPTSLRWLQDHRGLTEETVRAWKLGRYEDRYTIPIRNEDGQCVNLRRYKPGAAPRDKMISWRAGFGAARLWPLESLRTGDRPVGPVYLLEGEMDCLLGLQAGLRALTSTGGAGTWNTTWNERFRGLDVVIVYDCDQAGRAGARRIAEELAPVARSVRIVDLGLEEPPGADFTDYLHGHGNPLADFFRLAEQTAPFVLPRDPARVVEPPRPIASLAEASSPEHFGHPFTSSFLCSGKDVQPYQIPKTIEAVCGTDAGQHRYCTGCPLAATGGVYEFDLEYQDPAEWLEFTRTPASRVQARLRDFARIPAKCPFVRLTKRNVFNLERVQMIPDIDRAIVTNNENPYVTRIGWVHHRADHEVKRLEANRTYTFTGHSVADPKDQSIVHIVDKFEPAQTNLDVFTLQPEMREAMRVFQPSGTSLDALLTKRDEVYTDLERSLAVLERRDLMLAFDLVFHSVLTFVFQGQPLVRGWTECLVIGDARTGKSMLAERMSAYYQNGELTTGENTSFAGLVGGIDQMGSNFVVRWGKIPLNDRRLLIIDEAGSMPTEQIERMSGIRSSGRAEITKIHHERTTARTRAIWISNPRGRESLSGFTHGVLAVKQLIGKPEDIARFDLVLTAASRDVSMQVINAMRTADQARVFTSELCRQRVMWAWTRESDDVQWVDGAEQAVLDAANRHGEKYRYATEIPLVEPNEHRIRLARLAVATACLFFSTHDGRAVLVRPEHVAFVVRFLDEIYRKPSLSFADYADQCRYRNELRDVAEVQRLVFRVPGAIGALMSQEYFNTGDLQEILGLGRDDTRSTLQKLRFAGFLDRRGQSSYVKTPAAIRWLRAQIDARGQEGDDTPAPLVDALPDMPTF